MTAQSSPGWLTRLFGSKSTPAPVQGASPSLAAVTPETVTHGVAVHDPDIPAHNGVPVPFWPEHGVAAPAVPPELLVRFWDRF